MMRRFTDEQNVKIAKKEYSQLEVNDDLIIENSIKIGKVSQVNNKANGEQSFIVTSGKHAVVADAPLSEREKVKEVTILYRGSTEINQIKRRTARCAERLARK
ncbi:hypothetical protein MFLO_15533 [Listeria floridensis FSL S10-1187]|uniref:Uncharacterized protein n=1 Tax=Listeria floridensis FSL S10-1187 TaxID=1265817 RepID=A0ABP3AWQ4_9LIST|nr:hypothetical protein [Listeria floridensis]EUJ25334.1 hypothetical protein MFLO_15533 [Listeria floridensis FSL S10-1187]